MIRPNLPISVTPKLQFLSADFWTERGDREEWRPVTMSRGLHRDDVRAGDFEIGHVTTCRLWRPPRAVLRFASNRFPFSTAGDWFENWITDRRRREAVVARAAPPRGIDRSLESLTRKEARQGAKSAGFGRRSLLVFFQFPYLTPGDRFENRAARGHPVTGADIMGARRAGNRVPVLGALVLSAER
jgi:hypothetical protein